MKVRFTFKNKIFVIMATVFVMVLLAGYYAYLKFSAIVTQITEESRPDLYLVTAKSLMNDIYLAEGSVKSYTLTEDTMYIERFYQSIEKANEKLDQLYEMEANDSVFDQIDSLNHLIERKFIILDDLLHAKKIYRVQEALDKVIVGLEQVTVEEKKPQSDQQHASALSRFFQRKKEREELEKQLEKQRVSLLDVSKEVIQVKKEEGFIEHEIKHEELMLIGADMQVTAQIKELLDKLETMELRRIDRQVALADKAMLDVNRQIALFCVAISLMLFIMSFVIVNFVRSTTAYKKVLKKAKYEAEGLAETKERFLANMSHEIRTPMNAIAGFTEQIAATELTTQQREQLDMVQKSVEHLLYLINDVLDYSKLQAGKLTLERIPFKLHDVVSEVVTFVKPLGESKRLEIKTDIVFNKDKILIGDPFRLKQVLLNLLSNAIKFTKEGQVLIRVKSLMKSDQNVRIRFEVIDTGIGMTKGQVGKVFLEFEQAESSISRNYGGTGLGLSIVKGILTLQEGTIELSSQPGVGTTVMVEIPYDIGTVEDMERIEAQNQEPQHIRIPEKLKILVVDDEEYNRKLLTAILRKHQAIFTEAENGLQAIEEVERTQYDVILMDARMPELDGVEASVRIRSMKSKSRKNVPIIALTAAVSDEDKALYLASGMNGFLPKPFRENELLQELNRVLEIPEEENTLHPERMEDQQVLDVSALKELSGGDRVFYEDMLQTFINGMEDGFVQMDTHWKEEKYKMVGEYAHKMCSPCRHLQANQLYAHLKSIELKCSNHQDLPAIAAEIASAKTEYAKAKQLVEAELKNH